MRDVRVCIEPLPAHDSLGTLLVTPDERTAVCGFGSERRRAEYLMWRHMVRRELGADTEIGYDAVGAPLLTNRTEHIGVSHSSQYAAVIISDRRCAIDIESLARNFLHISSRYISPSERLLSDDPRLPAALWCAKETLYKYSGLRELDLLNDICIEKVDFGRKIIVGRICGGDATELRMMEYHGHLVVYIG